MQTWMGRAAVVVTLASIVACGSDGGDFGANAADTTASTAEAPAVTESSPPTAAAPATTSPTTTPPATTPPATTPSTTAASAPTTGEAAVSTSPETVECRRIDDFDDSGGWFIVNDGVMGGRSDGRAVVGDSTLRFFGTVVTAGGGFTSIRLRLDGDELAGTDRVLVRMRADDRTYGLTFEDDQSFEGRRVSHGADLSAPEPVDDDGYAVVELAYDRLEPSVFGFSVDAEPFRPDAAAEIGIIIGDGIDGEFALEVDWIDACA